MGVPTPPKALPTQLSSSTLLREAEFSRRFPSGQGGKGVCGTLCWGVLAYPSDV